MTKKNLFIYLIILYTFCVPVFPMRVGAIGNILVNGLLILFLLPVLLLKINKISTELRKNSYFHVIIILYALYFFLILFSLLIGALQIDSKIIIRDFYEFHKPVLYILILSSIYILYYKNPEDIDFTKIIYFIFVILIFFAYIQTNHYRTFSLLYIDTIIYNSNRLTAPFGNPYDHAFVAMFFCIFFFYKYIFQSLKFIIPFLISCWMLAETGSKSNAFGFLIIFIIFVPIIIMFSNIRLKKKIFFLSHLIILPILYILFNFSEVISVNYSMIYDQLSDFFRDGNIGDSGNVRIEQIYIVFERAINNPSLVLFGNGPAKGLELGFYKSGDIYYSEHLESAFVYILFRYGFVGILLFFSVYLIIFRLLLINNKNLDKFNDYKIFNLSFLTWHIFMVFTSIGGIFIEQPRVSFFFYLLLGFALIIKRNSNFYKNQ
jgi:hypothetical protein